MKPEARFSDAFLAAFEVFASKAPVNRYGPQAKALKAWSRIRDVLTQAERHAVDVAWGHALIGEGRAEFDAEVGKVRERLGLARD